MSIYNRDWYREDYNEREKKYGGDFSLHSKQVKQQAQYKGNLVYRSKKDALKDFLTIMAGAIPFLYLRYGNNILVALTRIGIHISNSVATILILAACTILEITLFAKAAKRRKEFDRRVLNLLALMVSMFSLVLMAMLLFFAVCDYMKEIG